MNINFSYLQKPVSLYSRQPNPTEALVTKNGKVKRCFFYNVPFTSDQLSQINQFKEFAQTKNQVIDSPNEEILRYLYSTEFNYKDCLEKLNVFIQWMKNPIIQTITPKAKVLLNQGVVFTFGRDIEDRPIIYLKIGQIDLKNNSLDDYYSAINAVLTVVTNYLFVKGVVESYLFVIDLNGKNFTSLPIDATISIIKKLSIVYSMYLGKMAIINTNYLMKLTYLTIKKFIHEETAKKIILLGCDQIQNLQKFVDPTQLEKRYSGQHDNLPIYWPPKSPVSSHHLEEQTIFYSVFQENEQFWIEHEREGSCCGGSECRIF